PRPGRSDRQRRRVPEKLGPGRQIVSQDSPSGGSRIGGQAGAQAPTLRPFHRGNHEAGPEELSTISPPNICGSPRAGAIVYGVQISPFGAALSAARSRLVPTAAGSSGSLAITNAPAVSGAPSAVTVIGTRPS